MIINIRAAVGRALAILLCALMILDASGLFLSSDAYAAQKGSRYTAEEYADILLAEMTTRQKIGQLMLVRTPQKNPATLQKKYQFGGYLLFGVDFANTTPAKFRKKVKNWQSKSQVKMLIATDEEGGTVVRASYYRSFRSSKFRSPRSVYKSGGWSGIRSYTRSKDRFLLDLGINTNLAPVADVTYKSSNFMYKRAFSEKPSSVSKFIGITADTMKKDNVVCALKHFPGYGGNGDTHGKIIRDKRSLKTYEKRDLKPFKTGISHGADMIMVSHVIVNAFDKKRPASISKPVHNYLRKDMGYTGVIISDGLGMKGLTEFVGGSKGETAVRAILAGNDMVIVDSEPAASFKAILKAVKSGRITKTRLNNSVRRILLMKIRKGIITIPAAKTSE